jgi:hypothetical protein
MTSADSADISASGSGYAVTLDVNETIGDLTIGNTAAQLTIGANSLIITTAGGLGGNAIVTTGAIKIAGGILSANGSGGIYVASGGSLTGFGQLFGIISGGGFYQARSGTLEVVDAVDMTATGLSIVNSDTVVLQIDNIVGAGATITFAGTFGTLKLTDFSGDVLQGFQGTIRSLNVGSSATVPTNQIDLGGEAKANITAASLNTTTDVVTVTTTGGSFTLKLSGSYASGTFVDWITDGAGTGSDLFLSNTPCYCRGTLILTDRGEVAVEELAIGDRVMTLSGAAKPVRWIGRRGYAGRFVAGNRAVLPIRVAAGALADGVPARDLWVSPEHALYIDGALVPAGLLVNGASILQAEEVEEVEYFHIEFAGHEVIFADGAPAESFVDDDSRGMFHNAAEFHALYPEAPSRVPASYCAPRVEEGFALEALCRRLLGRARHLGADGTAQPGVLRGNLELVHRDRIEGWAFDPASPDAPVALVVLANGAEIGRVLAERYRRDLEEAGIGDGQHGFELVVPGGLAAGVRHEIEVCREDDWRPLPGSPRVLEPVVPDLDRKEPHRSAAASVPLGALRGNLEDVDRVRIHGWAQDSSAPERRVGILVKLNDRVIGRVLANRYRGDLATAGIGDGRHAFELTIPNGLSALQAWRIEVQREADGAELPGSPLTLPAANGFDAAIEQNFAGILAAAAAGADEDRALSFLTQQTDQLLARRARRHGGQAEREAHHLFRRRWGPQAQNAVESFTAPHLRALIVDSSAPDATRDAGSVAILSHARALRALGYAVSFVAADDMHNGASLARVAEEEGITPCTAPHYASVEDVLSRQAGTFDLVYLHRAATAELYLPLVRRYCPKARIVYSVADLHHLRVARQAQIEQRPELLAYSRHLAAIELLSARRADIVVTHSVVEAEILRRAVGGGVHVVPFAVLPRGPRKPFSQRHGVAFIGSFGHAPNGDAVHYLTREIMPLVWQGDPTIICKIVGRGWPADCLAQSTRG